MGLLEQAERAQKTPYEPPKATFVPLRSEERLLSYCSKTETTSDPNKYCTTEPVKNS